ncbi:MAG: ParA family protein [Syntrophales bacterium]|nr:ParA family protein [Syntrophales bacterium]
MAKKIAFTNQKGGVGKTTAVHGLAAGLKIKGQRVLVVDLDAQGNASAVAGLIIENDRKTVKELLVDGGHAEDFIVHTDLVDIIPSNNSLKDIEAAMIEGKRFDALRKSLRSLKDSYDYILLDCPPSINVFTKNALMAADEVIIPVDMGFFSILGLKQLLEEIKRSRKELNRSLILRGVLICKFDRRTALSDQIFGILRESFPDKLFKTLIRINIDLVKAQIAQKSIFDYNPRSNGAEDFMSLTEEIIHG